jgi:lipid-binding SYLF domain-containing protein
MQPNRSIDSLSPQRCCSPCAKFLTPLQEDLRQLYSKANTELNFDRACNERYLNLPISINLESDIKKATYTLYNFTSDNSIEGIDRIPRELILGAKGIAFITILKAGFLFSGRLGTGLVISRLLDGSWSAPSAIMMSGMGWGFQIGGELTDVILILTTQAAIKAFSSLAQISVGMELGVSIGPVGRTAGTDLHGSNHGAAAAFSYAHSKGLFVGVSLESSIIASRPDVNRSFYGMDVAPSVLLSGDYPRPKAAEPLYKALSEVMTSIDESILSSYNNYSNSSNNNSNSGINNINNSNTTRRYSNEDAWTHERNDRIRKSTDNDNTTRDMIRLKNFRTALNVGVEKVNEQEFNTKINSNNNKINNNNNNNRKMYNNIGNNHNYNKHNNNKYAFSSEDGDEFLNDYDDYNDNNNDDDNIAKENKNDNNDDDDFAFLTNVNNDMQHHINNNIYINNNNSHKQMADNKKNYYKNTNNNSNNYISNNSIGNNNNNNNIINNFNILSDDDDNDNDSGDDFFLKPTITTNTTNTTIASITNKSKERNVKNFNNKINNNNNFAQNKNIQLNNNNNIYAMYNDYNNNDKKNDSNKNNINNNKVYINKINVKEDGDSSNGLNLLKKEEENENNKNEYESLYENLFLSSENEKNENNNNNNVNINNDDGNIDNNYEEIRF